MASLGNATTYALEQFQALEMMQRGHDTAHAEVKTAYAGSLALIRERVVEACDDPKVIATLARAALAGSGKAGASKRLADPLFRLATYFLSSPSVEHGFAIDTTVNAWHARIAGGLYLSRSLAELNLSLPGTALGVGEHQATIDAVRPQDVTHNAKFASRPIFGTNRADAYTSAFMGHRLLFLRAAAAENLSCVCIMAATIDHEPVARQGLIGSALELPGESIADVLLEDDQLVLRDVRSR